MSAYRSNRRPLCWFVVGGQLHEVLDRPRQHPEPSDYPTRKPPSSRYRVVEAYQTAANQTAVTSLLATA